MLRSKSQSCVAWLCSDGTDAQHLIPTSVPSYQKSWLFSFINSSANKLASGALHLCRVVITREREKNGFGMVFLCSFVLTIASRFSVYGTIKLISYSCKFNMIIVYYAVFCVFLGMYCMEKSSQPPLRFKWWNVSYKAFPSSQKMMQSGYSIFWMWWASLKQVGKVEITWCSLARGACRCAVDRLHFQVWFCVL